MEVRVKEVALWDILCVNFAELHSMAIMNCTVTWVLNTINVIYATGNQAIFSEKHSNFSITIYDKLI